MKTLILDGSHIGDPISAKINATLHAQIPDAETIVLREQKLGSFPQNTIFS
jgi:hypothetical protein